MKKFRKSAYWGRWSRVLGMDNKGYIHELNLTPIPSCSSSAWKDDVATEKFRRHFTATSKEDICTDNLPQEVYDFMVKNIGQELTDKLINHDYLLDFTFEDIRNSPSNGGTTLAQILESKRTK